MQYMCLVYMDRNTFEGWSEPDIKAFVRESLAYDDELRRSGHFLGANALQPDSTATTIRVRNKKMSSSDGPFAETKEQLGGYILVDAKDLNEAIQIAAKIPMARLGSVEVRPVLHLEP